MKFQTSIFFILSFLISEIGYSQTPTLNFNLSAEQLLEQCETSINKWQEDLDKIA